jgi:hypothetical protein
METRPSEGSHTQLRGSAVIRQSIDRRGNATVILETGGGGCVQESLHCALSLADQSPKLKGTQSCKLC